MNQFLREYYVDDRNDYYNIVSMITPRGKYNIDRKQYDYFMREFSSQKSGIAEIPQLHIPLYFDFDIKKDSVENGEVHFYTEEQVKSIISIITTLTKKHFDVKDKDLFCCLLEKDIYQKSNGKFSNGFHLHFPSIFVSRDIFRTFMLPILEAKIKQETGFIIDDVYTHPWLLYGNVKDDKLQPYILTKVFNVELNQMTVFDAFKNYKIFDEEEKQIQINDCNVDSLLPRIFSINVFGRNVNELVNNFDVDIPKKIVNIKPKIEDNRPLSEKAEEVKKFLPLILDNETHQNWYTIGQAIYNILEGQDEGLQLFIDWSRSASNFEESSCENLWKNMRFSNSGMGTLIYQAKLDSKSEYDEIVSVKPKLVFIEEEEIVFNDKIDIKKEDDYFWVDFERRYMNTVFQNLEDLKQNIIQDLPRVLTKITLGKGFYIKKEHKDALCDLIPIKDMTRIVFKFNSSFRNKKGQYIDEILTISLNDIYTECKLPLYSHPDMILDKNIKSNAYNIFKGICANKTTTINLDLINKFLNHIENVICSDNKEASHFFISWIRWIMIHPHIKTKVFVFLFSEEGYGKSSISEFLSKYVFGETASHFSSGLDTITGSFNKHLLGKLFCHIEELPTTSENFHKQFDNMKTLITDNKMFCNPKGVDGFKMNNFLNFLGCSNNKYSLRMPKTDTRYFVLEITKKMNSDYWTEYHKDFTNQEFADMLFSYFLQTKDDDYVCFNGRPKIPMTDLKRELIDFSLPVHEKFYNDIMNGEYKLSKEIIREGFVYKNKEYNFATSLLELWGEYLNWGTINAEKDLKRKYLGFTQHHNGKFRFIDLQEKITNVQSLEFQK